MSSPFLGPGNGPRRLIPPKPGPPGPHARFGTPAPGQFARKHPLPPNLGPDRDPNAVYVLDTGVGLSFAHVSGGMNLLGDHYGSQLRYTEDVLIEWRSQAAKHIGPLEPGHTEEFKAEREHLLALKAAASRCLSEMPARFGDAIDLGYDEADNVDALVTELCALHPARSDIGEDRGECASVRLAEILRAETPVVIICTNDDRGRRLASGHGIAHRNAGAVLREMVREDRLSAEDAYSHYQAMVALSGIRTWALMTSPDDFR